MPAEAPKSEFRNSIQSLPKSTAPSLSLVGRQAIVARRVVVRLLPLRLQTVRPRRLRHGGDGHESR